MEEQKRYVTDFLFSTPSFLSGAGTVINLAGNYHKFNASNSGFEADKKAIENDFRMVGQDICDVIENIKEDNKLLLLVK